jgi:tRNA pseudouridine55 synthase
MMPAVAKRPLHGWLVIDKPAGMTSAAVVGAVRRLTGAAKAGHGGTLDPLATGVLPIALGEATKTVSFILDGTKIYRFTIRWGESRNTDDADGDVTAVSDHRPDAAAIAAVLPVFLGEIEQVPPAFSAVKVAGRRAYQLARADAAVDLAPRQASIDRIALVAVPDADHAELEVASGKGVYMRALARDIAAALGTCGHVSALRRLRAGPFSEAEAITLDKLSGIGHSHSLEHVLLPIGQALAGIPALILTEVEAKRLQHGQAVAVLPVASRSSLKHVDGNAVFCATAKGKPVALAEIRGGELRPVRVLNL